MLHNVSKFSQKWQKTDYRPLSVEGGARHARSTGIIISKWVFLGFFFLGRSKAFRIRG